MLAVEDQGHRLEVVHTHGQWQVLVEGDQAGEPEDFVAFLWTLARSGQAVVGMREEEYVTPVVTTGIESGYGSDLLWWLTEAYSGEVLVNGEEWDLHVLDAPAPGPPWSRTETSAWTVDCLIDWEMPSRAGHAGGPGSDYGGTAFVGRIGRRLALWESDHGEFLWQGSWATMEDVARLVASESYVGGALTAWPARVQAPDPIVAGALRSSLWYPGYWLNGSLVVRRPSDSQRPSLPIVDAPASEWLLQSGLPPRRSGVVTELTLGPATHGIPPSSPSGTRWELPVDREWLEANDSDTLARLCLACDQQEHVRYGSVDLAGRPFDAVEAERFVVMELAREFGLTLVLCLPAMLKPGMHVLGCDTDGDVLWFSPITDVANVDRPEVVLGRMTYDLEFY